MVKILLHGVTILWTYHVKNLKGMKCGVNVFVLESTPAHNNFILFISQKMIYISYIS